MSRTDSPAHEPDPPVEEVPVVTRMFRRLLEARPSPVGRPYKLSEIAQATGLPVAYLRDLRNGGFTMPTLDRAQRLADFFGVEPRYLLGQEGCNEDPVGVQQEPDGHYRLALRLNEGQYHELSDIAHRWSITPVELLRALIATVLGDLEVVTPAVHRDSRLGRVMVGAVLQALVVVYERQVAAYNEEIEPSCADGGTDGGASGAPRERREGDTDEQPATQRRSRSRRRRTTRSD